eukprot:3843317-Rhodomonas_salina.1
MLGGSVSDSAVRRLQTEVVCASLPREVFNLLYGTVVSLSAERWELREVLDVLEGVFRFDMPHVGERAAR